MRSYNHYFKIVALLACCICISACSNATNSISLTGTWQVETCKMDGQSIDVLPEWKFVFDNQSNLTMSCGSPFPNNSVPFEFKFKIDGKQTPAHINLYSKSGDNKSPVQIGIIKQDRQFLWLCLSPDINDRPTKFTSTESKGITLYKLKPVK